MTFMAMHQHKNPCPWCHEIYNFGRPLLGHYYILCLSDICLGVEKKIAKNNNAFSLFDIYDHTLAQEPLSQGSWNLQFLVDPPLVIITKYLVCLIYAWE